jgi:Tol biopolymer transport system component
MILSLGLVAIAGLAFGWLHRLISQPGRCGWLTEVAVPGAIVAYSVIAMLPKLVAISAPSVLIAGALSVVAGFLFDRESSVESGGSELSGRRNTWPLLIWGVGALGYVGVPLASYIPNWKSFLDGLTGGMVGVGAGAMLGQTLSWVWRLVAAQRPKASKGVQSSIAGSNSGLSRIGGSVAAAIAVWLLLPSVGGGVKAPANSLLVGTGSLGNETIYILDFASGNYRPLSAKGGRAHWSPDGTRMALTRKEGAYMQLWVANIDGSNLRRLTDVPGDVVDCLWSADSRRIYFAHGKSFLQSGLSAISRDGGAPEEILPVSEAVSLPVISPDGRTMAYYRSTDFSAGPVAPPQQIKVFDLGSRQSTVVMSQPSSNWNVTGLTWTPDGQALVFATQTDSNKPSRLERLDLSGRQRKVLADKLPYRLSSFTWVGRSALAMLAYPIASGAGGKGEIWLVEPTSGNRKRVETSGTVNANSIHASASSATGQRTVEYNDNPASQRTIQPQPATDKPPGVPPAPPLGR